MKGTLTTTDGTRLPVEIKVMVIDGERKTGPCCARVTVCFFGELWLSYDVIERREGGHFSAPSKFKDHKNEWVPKFLQKREFSDVVNDAILKAYANAVGGGGYQSQPQRQSYAPAQDDFPSDF